MNLGDHVGDDLGHVTRNRALLRDAIRAACSTPPPSALSWKPGAIGSRPPRQKSPPARRQTPCSMATSCAATAAPRSGSTANRVRCNTHPTRPANSNSPPRPRSSPVRNTTRNPAACSNRMNARYPQCQRFNPSLPASVNPSAIYCWMATTIASTTTVKLTQHLLAANPKHATPTPLPA